MDKKIIGIVALLIVVVMAVGVYFLTTPDDGVVKIGYLVGDYDAALIVANVTGMYKSEGIEVNITPYNDDRELITAMATGEVDVAYVDIANTLKYIEKDVPIKIISSSQNGGSGVIVSNQSGVNSVNDLYGKRIAIPSEDSIQYILFNNYLKQHGISVDDLNISSHSVSSVNKSIQKGKLDVAVVYEPYVTINQNNGSKILLNSDTLFPNHPNCVMIASDDFISKHPDEARKVVQIHENATKYLNNSTGWVYSKVPMDSLKDPALKRYYYDNVSLVYGLDDDFKHNVDDFMKILVDQGNLKQPIPHEKIYWSGS